MFQILDPAPGPVFLRERDVGEDEGVFQFFKKNKNNWRGGGRGGGELSVRD